VNALRPDTGAVLDHVRWLALLEHGAVEVRAIDPRKVASTLVGYFDAIGPLLETVRALSNSSEQHSIYIGTQPRPTRLLERSPNELRAGVRGASADDIETLAALYIDIDPVRSDGAEQQAATDVEVAIALEAADRAADYMAREGFLRPVIVMVRSFGHACRRRRSIRTTETRSRQGYVYSRPRCAASSRVWASL
jgi:hypothetical protein